MPGLHRVPNMPEYLFICFVVLVFPLFGASKDLISDS